MRSLGDRVIGRLRALLGIFALIALVWPVLWGFRLRLAIGDAVRLSITGPAPPCNTDTPSGRLQKDEPSARATDL